MAEKEYYHLTVSVSKALNGIEAPLKTKHARSIIIMIHKAKEAKSFWMVISRQPLMESRFTAWKFCHLLHKVLREAHECALKHSQTHKKMILEMGKLWGHLQDDMGYCIRAYSKLLVTKLTFHDKNRMIPGSLNISMDEIAKYADKDLNLYFELCVEIFDFLDDIIEVELAIFTSINTYRMSSMTQQGQCRLAPFICLIQDSNSLYDISARLMFKLHDQLPSDVLAGHRSRFNDIFIKLKTFYDNVRPLQYFAELIQVPQLPASIPNFRSQVDFGSYIPPVLLVQPEPEPIVDDLVNTTICTDSNSLQDMLTERVDTLESVINDKDVVIEQLELKLEVLKSKYAELGKNYSHDILELQNSNTSLCNELASSKEIFAKIRLEKDELELQVSNNPMLTQKVVEEEEKLKLASEKFNKLKTMYAQIRDEHITLLRQQSEMSKNNSKEKQTNSELTLEIKTLTNDLLESNALLATLKENNAKLAKEIEDQKEHYIKFESLQKNLCADLEGAIQLKNLENNDLNSTVNDLKENICELETYRANLQKAEEKLTKANSIIKEKDEELQAHAKSYERDLKKYSENIEELKQEHSGEYDILKSKYLESKSVLQQKEIDLQEYYQSITGLKQEKEELQKHSDTLKQNVDSREKELANALTDVKTLNELKNKSDTDILEIKRLILESMENICTSKLNELTQNPLDMMPKTIVDMENILNKMKFSSINLTDSFKDHAGDVVLLGSLFLKMYDQCDLVFKSSAEIEQGQAIFNKGKSVCERILQVFQMFQKFEDKERVDSVIDDIKFNLQELKKLVDGMLNTYENKIDLDKLVEIELREMDFAIEEAANKIIDLLSTARKKDNGIKLNVNEKILDACTNLMECIKILIMKSRVLQHEIISSRKGNVTVNEFYKRNSQWSEGLISASKNIAKAANYLVEAANNAIESESGKNFELIVAAQEIAACTAQLVIASKVKANRESQNLIQLTNASRNVTKATGSVVATVKDGNIQLEQADDIADFRKMTPSQVKTMEMEIHVKVLELEQALQTHRLKLSAFRREHYQNTEY